MISSQEGRDAVLALFQKPSRGIPTSLREAGLVIFILHESPARAISLLLLLRLEIAHTSPVTGLSPLHSLPSVFGLVSYTRSSMDKKPATAGSWTQDARGKLYFHTKPGFLVGTQIVAC